MVKRRGLGDRVIVSRTTCLKHCSHGVTVAAGLALVAAVTTLVTIHETPPASSAPDPPAVLPAAGAA